MFPFAVKGVFLMKVKLFAAAVGVFGLVTAALAACPLCA
jgi:hypothetical protein